LLGLGDAAVPGGGEGRAEQGAAAVQGEPLAGVEHGARGGLAGELTQVMDVSDGLFQSQPFVLVTVFDGERRHRQSVRDHSGFLAIPDTNWWVTCLAYSHNGGPSGRMDGF
jgi:hypothetical protein